MRAKADIDTASVAIVFSTGWVWGPAGLSNPGSVRFDEVEIRRIDVIHGDTGRALVPKVGTGIIWGLAFMRSECEGYAFFRPGFLPVYSKSDKFSESFSWSPLAGGAARVQLEPIASATTQPSKYQDFDTVLGQKQFWNDIRSRYVAGRDRHAIELICQ